MELTGGGDRTAQARSAAGAPAEPPVPAMPAAPPPPPGATGPVPRPAPGAPPSTKPYAQTTDPSGIAAWAIRERATEPPGVYADGFVPRRLEPVDEAPPRQAWVRAVLAVFAAALLWGLALWVEQTVWGWIVQSVTAPRSGSRAVLVTLNQNLLFPLLWLWACAWFGGWWPLGRHLVRRAARRAESRTAAAQAPPVLPDSLFPELRAAGFSAAADRLDLDARSGRLNDVDYARLGRAWEWALADAGNAARFAEEAERHGAAAFGRASGARDVPFRTAQHDLMTAQVRLAAVMDTERNPAEYRAAGLALDPATLGTSLLAVGAGGTGETERVVRPVAESLCLQALSGTAVLVAVTAGDADLGPRDSYDYVIAPGDPSAPDRLDLYGCGTPEQAARCLAEALLPPDAEHDAERARTALQHLVVPFTAAFDRGPGIQELRALLEGDEEALRTMGLALHDRGLVDAHAPELRARIRQQQRPDDPGPLLADRLAALDRPSLDSAFTPGHGAASTGPPDAPSAVFAMDHLDRPLRVRIELPGDGHPEAARILARLVTAQFVRAAASRADRSLFAALLLDDAAPAVDSHLLRGAQRLRSANAGLVLTMPTLADVPEPLRAPLLGAVGCRIALPRLQPWDARIFSEAWGTAWVEENAVTRAPDRSGGVFRRLLRGVRAAATGRPAETESVTTRRVERPVWSAAELSGTLADGQAVASLTTKAGAHVPPLLVDLRG